MEVFHLFFLLKKGIRGRWPLPVIGDVLQIMFRPVCFYDYDCFLKYGKVYYDHSILGYTMLVTSDPEMIHSVLVKDHHVFTERMSVPYLPPYLRKGIIFLDYLGKFFCS